MMPLAGLLKILTLQILYEPDEVLASRLIFYPLFGAFEPPKTDAHKFTTHLAGPSGAAAAYMPVQVVAGQK
jgi:hypothetical protein